MGLKHLSQLSFYGNPLECDCELKKTWQWCKNSNIHVIHKTPFCMKPRNMFGKSWDFLESLKCLNYSLEEGFCGSYRSYVEPLIFTVILLFGAAGTGALLSIFASYERILEIPNACVFSIAVGDFIMIMVFLPMSFVSAFTQVWKFGLPMCKMFMFTRDLTVGVNVFSVMVLGYHGYTWTVLSSLARNCCIRSSSKAAVLYHVGIWFVAATLAFPVLFSAANDHDTFNYAPETLGFYFTPCVTLIQLFIYSIMPPCFIILIYVVTQKYITLKSQKISEEVGEKKMDTRMKLSKIIVSLTFVLFISYAPSMVVRSLVGLSLLNQNSDITEVLVFLTDCLFYSNTWFNPLALYCSCSTYKGHFRRIIHCERFRKQKLKRKNIASFATTSEVQSSVAEMRY